MKPIPTIIAFGLLSLLSLVVFLPLQAQPSPESREMCSCMEQGARAKDKAKLRECLKLQEKHVKKLKEGSPAHEAYRKEVSMCESRIAEGRDHHKPDPSKMSFDEKVEHVCHCFSRTKAEGKRPMECFRIQSDFAKTTGERSTEFNQKTNNCAG